MSDRKRRSFWSVQSKIIFTIYVILVPVLIVTGIFMNQRNTRQIMAETTRQYENSTSILNQTIDYMEQDLLDIFTYVLVNDDVTRVLRASPDLGEEDPLFWRHMSPMNFVTDMLHIKGTIQNFILYPENGLTPYYNSQDGSVLYKNIADIRDSGIYRRAIQARGNPVQERYPAGTGGLFEKNTRDKIVLAREILDGSKRNPLGFIALAIDVEQYEAILNQALLQPGDGIVLLDGSYGETARAGEVDPDVLAYITSEQLTETVRSNKGLQAVAGHYVFAAPRSTDGWVFYTSPKSAWDTEIHKGVAQPVMILLALLLSALPISMAASRFISRPLSRLHASMTKFKEGDFSQNVQVTSRDEIAELSATFNDMVRDLKDMIDKNYVMVIREKESELDALQSQINPHFLYNALDSLYWQANDAGEDELAENILALAEVFRLVLSSGKSEITVRQELKLITNYLNIQKMRFGDKLNTIISVDEAIMDCLIPKLILQPFVENAIVHGLERLDRDGAIQIRGWLEAGSLQFVIEDNGVGMPGDKLQEILFAGEDERYADQRVGNFAIRNIKERLQLTYDGGASLEIQSRPGSGTRVSIRLPAGGQIKTGRQETGIAAPDDKEET